MTRKAPDIIRLPDPAPTRRVIGEPVADTHSCLADEIWALPLDLPPGAEDLGPFRIPGEKPGDRVWTRRISVSGSIFRVIVFEDQADAQ